MPSPDDYRRAAQFRASSAEGPITIDNATGRPVAISPVRQASPESDDAEPAGGMVSRANDVSWLPGVWMGAIATNDDPHLLKSGEGLKLYDTLLSDDTAASSLQQRRLAITSREYEVVAGDDKDPRSVKAADDFRAMIDQLRFDHVTGLLHYGVWYGYAVGEGLFSIKRHDGRLIVWLDDIVVPDRRHFGFTVEGELRFVGALGLTGDAGKLPDNKFVTIRTGGTHDFAFYGLGLAHWCYWPIFFKRAALKFWALYLEKRGRPTVAVEFTDAQKDDKAAKANLLAGAMAVGNDSAVLFPEGTLENKRLHLLESARSTQPDYVDFYDKQDEAIMRVILGSPGTSKATPGGLGGDGQARKDEGVKSELVKADSDLITDAIGGTFGKWVTRWNHGDDVAPPIVRRILEDSEDVNTTAERDAKLDGIGIKRTEESVKATYGDGYVLERETPEEKAQREKDLIAAKAGTAAPANDNAQAARQKIAEFAAQGGDKPFSPLYISRQLLNRDEVDAWAKSQGFTVRVPKSDLHTTILYSKTAVDWFAMAGEGWDWNELTIESGGPRFVERFGEGPDAAVVLRFASPVMRYRHDSMIERGASSDYPDFKPHVTISYDAAGVDLAQVEPFTGELRFGPEIFEPIRAKSDEADGFLAFTAEQEDAIDRLAASMMEEGHPVFAAMADHLRDALQGVTTAEGARIAILQATENLPVERFAQFLAVPLFAERAGASVGAEDDVSA